jgi:hypothetical protein
MPPRSAALALTLALAALSRAALASAPPTQLQALIDAAVARGAPSLTLPAGSVFAQGAAPLLITASDFLLDGAASRVVFAPGAGVVIERSTRVEVRALTIAYDPPCFAQGALVAVNGSASPRTFDVRLDDGFPAPDAPFFTSVETKFMLYDPTTLLRVPQSGSCIVTVVPGAVAPGVYRLREAFSCGTLPADALTLRVTVSSRINGLDFQIPGGYVGGAWWLFNSTAVTTKNVTLLGSGNFAISEWGGGGGHLYDGVVLTRDAERGALLSSNTDGFHSFAVSVGPTLTRSRLEFMGDDVANVHNRVGIVLAARALPSGDYAVSIIDVGDTPTPRLNASEPARALAFARAGDVLKVTSAGGAPRGGTAGGALVLASIAWDATPATVAAAIKVVNSRSGIACDPRGVGVWAAVFKAPATFDIAPLDITQFDRFAGAGVRVVDNVFSDAYDSCFRLQASGALIANNSWTRTSGGISVTYDPAWLEGASDIVDVAVNDCTFRSIGYKPVTRVQDIFSVSSTVKNFSETGNSILPP